MCPCKYLKHTRGLYVVGLREPLSHKAPNILASSTKWDMLTPVYQCLNNTESRLHFGITLKYDRQTFNISCRFSFCVWVRSHACQNHTDSAGKKKWVHFFLVWGKLAFVTHIQGEIEKLKTDATLGCDGQRVLSGKADLQSAYLFKFSF